MGPAQHSEQRAAPPPARVPGNLWTELSVAELGSLEPRATVSVVVVGGDPGRLDQTISALANQTYPAELVEVVAPAGAAAPQGLELRAVEGGLSERAAAASGEVLVLLGAGQVPARELVEAHARWHHAVADAVSVGHTLPLEGTDPKALADAQAEGRLAELVAGHASAAADPLEPLLEQTRGLTELRPDLFRVAGTGTLALRSQTLSAAGGIGTAADPGLARTDLAFRLQAHGCVFVPERAALCLSPYPERSPLSPDPLERGPDQDAPPPDARLASLIPLPELRPRLAGRIFERPAMVVEAALQGTSAAEALETVDAVLSSRFCDLELRLELGPDHPHRELIERAVAADPRVKLAEPGHEPTHSPLRVALPALAVPDERTLGDIHELMHGERLGALHVTVPGRLDESRVRLLSRRGGVLGRLAGRPAPRLRQSHGPALSALATGPLSRARRLAAAEGADPEVLLGELFGERWISGVEVSLRRRGHAEPQVTEQGPLEPASDLSHERAEHLRERARSYTTAEYAERNAQRARREQLRAGLEKARADRLEARLARMSPRYFVSWRGRRVLRRLETLPRRVRRRVEPLRHRLYHRIKGGEEAVPQDNG